MYSYSKTRGLFGGVSIEGSVIVERSDANSIAYEDDVTAQMLLGGMIPPPSWALGLIGTLEACTGMPKHSKWIVDTPERAASPKDEYPFGLPSPSTSPAFGKKKPASPFQQLGRSRRKSNAPSIDFDLKDESTGRSSSPGVGQKNNGGVMFDTHFDSDFVIPSKPSDSKVLTGRLIDIDDNNIPYPSPFATPVHSAASSSDKQHYRARSASIFKRSGDTSDQYNPFSSPPDISTHTRSFSLNPTSLPSVQQEVTHTISEQGLTRGIALYSFDAIEVSSRL